MPAKSFLHKRVAIAGIAAFAAASIAAVAIVPAIAAASSSSAGLLAASPAPSATPGHGVTKAVATRRIALALFRESVKETGLSRTTVLKDLLNGETLAQIDGSKAPAVQSAVMTRITARLTKAVAKGKLTQVQATALSAAASAGMSKVMSLNLSTYIHVRFGGFATAPSRSPSTAAATGSSTPI